MSDVSAEDLSGDFIVDLKSTAERGRCRRDEQPPLNMPSRNGPFVSSKRPSGSTEPVAANAISSAIDRVSRIIWLRKWFQSLAFLNDGRHRQNGTTQSAFNWPRQVLLISFFFLFLFFFCCPVSIIFDRSVEFGRPLLALPSTRNRQLAATSSGTPANPIGMYCLFSGKINGPSFLGGCIFPENCLLSLFLCFFFKIIIQISTTALRNQP